MNNATTVNPMTEEIHDVILSRINSVVDSLPQEKKETVDRKLTELLTELENFEVFMGKVANVN